jgi:predicted RNA binding protein YcfA (HicA-like mRNA interferase family)
MTGKEFLRKVHKLCRKRGWVYEWYPNMGKGSHGVLKVNGAFTVVRYLSDELKDGTLHGMLKQLGLKKSDL